MNSSYLEVMRGIVDTLADAGVSTLVDVHQDCLSEKYCGEGVPLWAAQSPGAAAFPEPLDTPYELNSDGVPSAADCGKHSWSDYQALTEAGSQAYQSLYSNVDGLGDAFVAYWRTLAALFADSPAVMGYEVLNEPFAGAVFKDPALLVPGVADRENLQPLYEKVAAAVRAEDAAHTLLYEGVTWDDVFPLGFNATPGGAAARNRTAVSFHYYSNVNFNASWQMSARLQDATRLGWGGMLTEFDIGGSTAEQERTMALADAHGLSWTGWEYKQYVPMTGWNNGPFSPSGAVNATRIAALARTYPLAVAGHNVTFAFAPANGAFTLHFTPHTGSASGGCPSPGLATTTVVFASTGYVYPGGFNVTLTPPSAGTVTVRHLGGRNSTTGEAPYAHVEVDTAGAPFLGAVQLSIVRS